MHEYRQLVEREMNANEAFKGRGGQTRLAAEADLSKQVINSILKDSRERLNQVPDEKTVVGLAKAFRIEPEVIWSAVAVALGLPSYVVPSITHEVRTAHNAVLLGELGKRLGLEVTVRTAQSSEPLKGGEGQKIPGKIVKTSTSETAQEVRDQSHH